MASQAPTSISVLGLAGRHRWKILVTLGLVVLESIVNLLFPLFLGFAINGLLEDSYDGLIALGGLAAVALVVGAARRFYDTRVYSGIYAETAEEMVAREHERGTPTSAIAARSNLLTELVEFLENSLPTIVANVIAVVGTLAILVSLNVDVFFACLALVVVVVLVYMVTGRFTYRLHRGYNDELERQVTVIEGNDTNVIQRHYDAIRRWNIRLSDLETGAFSVVWIGIIGLLIVAPILVIEPGVTEYGFAFSTLLYVFTYIESAIAFPLYVQEVIRLQEIATRLKGPAAGAGDAESEPTG